MRRFAALILMCADPGAAQTPGFNPAAAYITPGQDEAGYRGWYLADPARAGQVAAYNAYLADRGVAGIVPTWQLLRTATDWRKCGAQPFEVPPIALWPRIVATLRYVHEHVVPAVGPVEPVSVYRNPALNQCAGGAPESAHKELHAIDLVPLRPTTREELIRMLCAIHSGTEDDHLTGVGFYIGLRFHVDSKGFRSWGSGDVPCALPRRKDFRPDPLVLQRSNTTSPATERGRSRHGF